MTLATLIPAVTTIAQPDEADREQLHRQILSSVSHDLKTPLVSIIGSLEVCARMDERLSKEQRQRLLDVALQEAYRLDAFITNILDMAKLENSAVRPRLEVVDIRMLLSDSIARLGIRAKDSKIELDIVPTGRELRIDGGLLARAVNIVLENAIKYGGVNIRVTFDEDEKGPFIAIADNGAGIPEGCHESIFAKYTHFAQGDQKNAGPGLGLPICREIMRLLQGSVTAKNGADGGAVFTLRLARV